MTAAAKGGTILILAFFITSILNYIFNVSLGWFLTPQQFGLYGVSIAMLTIVKLVIDTGFPWSAAKFLSEDIKQEEKYNIFNSILLGSLLTAVTVSILFYIIYLFLLPLEEVYSPLITMIIAITIISAVKLPFIGALQGFFRFGDIGMLNIMETFLKLVFGIGLVYLGFGVFGSLIGFAAGGLFGIIFSSYLIRDFRFWKGKVSIDKQVLSFVFSMSVGMLWITLVQNLDIMGLKFLSGDMNSNKLAGYYQAVLIIARIPYFISGAMMMAMFPYISKLGLHHKQGPTYRNTPLKFIILFVFPISIAISLIPESFINLMFPNVYTAGARALAIVSPGMGFLATILILCQIFQAIGKPRVPAIVLTATVSIQVCLLVLLIPKFGLVGAALSTTLSCFFGMSLLAQIYRTNFKIIIEKKKIYLFIFTYLVASTFLIILPHNSRILTVFDLIVSGVVYLITLALFRLITEKDAKIIMDIIPNEKLSNALSKLIIKLNGFAKWN